MHYSKFDRDRFRERAGRKRRMARKDIGPAVLFVGIRKDHAPENIAALRRIALNLLRQERLEPYLSRLGILGPACQPRPHGRKWHMYY